MQIDETKIPASYDGQPGKCLVFYLFQLTIVNPFPYTFPIKTQCFWVLIEMYFLKYLISIFLCLLFKMFFFVSLSYHIAPYLPIDILHKNYILDLYKMTMGYSVQMQKKLQWNRFALSIPLRGRRSPVAPFSCSDVKSYGKEKYSFIHILYSLIIHCFNSK